ncbi:MAG: HNH endonuclease [Phycisphaerae bacterium]
MPDRRPKWGGRRAARLRAATLDAYGTVCHLCGRPGADSADHLIPRALGGPDTLDNLRPAHKSCNSARGTGVLGGQVTVVTGPPAAGKTTFVRENARPGDVVIDYDVLAVALQLPGAPSHDHPRAVLHVAAAARSAAIAAATGPRSMSPVWIIDTKPTPKRLAGYRARGWRVVTLDPGRDVVLARAREQRPGSAIPVIHEWYADVDVVASTTPEPSRAW